MGHPAQIPENWGGLAPVSEVEKALIDQPLCMLWGTLRSAQDDGDREAFSWELGKLIGAAGFIHDREVKTELFFLANLVLQGVCRG